MIPGKALLHCGDPGQVGASTSPIRWSWPVSDGHGQLVECDRHPPAHGLLDRQLVVSTPNVLHQRMPRDDHPGAAILLRPRIGPSRAFNLL
jgi:hypothetical protein